MAITIEKLMDNLIVCLLEQLEKTTIEKLAEKCELSYEGLCKILYRKTKDIKCSSLLKICENTGISLAELLDISETEIFRKMIRDFELSDGKLSFLLRENEKE